MKYLIEAVGSIIGLVLLAGAALAALFAGGFVAACIIAVLVAVVSVIV